MKELFDNLEHSGVVLSMAETGGTLSKKESKDVDYIALVQDKNKLKEYINGLYDTQIIDDSVRIVDESFVKNINIALYTKDELEKKISNYTTKQCPLGEKREWASGYWVPEIFVFDILNSKIIFDSGDNYRSIIEYTLLNKEGILENMHEKIEQEISIKLEKLNKRFLDKSKSTLKGEILKLDIILSLFRLEHLYDPLNFEFLDITSLNLEELLFLEAKDFIQQVNLIRNEHTL